MHSYIWTFIFLIKVLTINQTLAKMMMMTGGGGMGMGMGGGGMFGGAPMSMGGCTGHMMPAASMQMNQMASSEMGMGGGGFGGGGGGGGFGGFGGGSEQMMAFGQDKPLGLKINKFNLPLPIPMLTFNKDALRNLINNLSQMPSKMSMMFQGGNPVAPAMGGGMGMGGMGGMGMGGMGMGMDGGYGGMDMHGMDYGMHGMGGMDYDRRRR